MYFNNHRSQSELGLQYRAVSDTLNAHIRQILDDQLLVRVP